MIESFWKGLTIKVFSVAVGFFFSWTVLMFTLLPVTEEKGQPIPEKADLGGGDFLDKHAWV